MKYFFLWLAFFVFVIVVLPLGLNFFLRPDLGKEVSPNGEDIQVYFHREDTVRSVRTEDYIRGVLMAEMPAEFELEALKAQAVAARTYTARFLNSSHLQTDHPEAAVCTDPAHCQAYITDEEAKKKWGKNASFYLDKCKNAVLDTAGEIAVFDGEPILAVFHSVSGGRTEDASEVWQGDVAYLKSVDSPGEESAPKYRTQAEFTMEEFKSRLAKEWDIDFSGGMVGEYVLSRGGSVKTVDIGNKTIKGTDIRRIFELASADFVIDVRGDTVVFNVLGYGHGVGMSQYGANHYAKEGLGYREILSKYYTGIEFDNMYE